MSHIELLDATLRDGQQSLWGMRMQAGMALPVPDLLRAAIHRTPMRAGMRGNACVSFGVTPDALMDLWMRRLNEHGVRSFWIYDVLYGVDNFARLARIAKEYDSEVIGTVFFSLSPVHTDEYLCARTAEIAAVPELDGVLFYDTAG